MRYRGEFCTRFLLLALAGCAAVATALAASGTLVVTLPGDTYSAWLEYRDASGAIQSTAPVVATAGKAALALPDPNVPMHQPVLVAVDSSTGNVALKPVTLKPGAPSEVTVQPSDVNAVELLRVRCIGADGQPADRGAVTLTDSKKRTQTLPILPGHDGTVEFPRVPFGRATVKVTFADGSALSQDVDVTAEHAPGAVTVELAKAGTASRSSGGSGGSAPAEPADAPAAKAPANAPADAGEAQPKSTGPGGVGSLVALVLLAMVCYVGYRLVKERGTTLVGVLQRLGVQLPQDEPAPADAKPAAPPRPLVPEGSCPFCGAPKDPVTGRCACTVDSAPLDAAVPLPGTPQPGGGQPPRLVVVQGPALGRSFALGSSVLMVGRAAESDVALPEDGAVSRRHARLEARGEGYLLRDEGSANGTFVNGVRITERLLQPGDEIQIGNSRLRYEG